MVLTAHPFDFLLAELVAARHVGQRAGRDEPRLQQLAAFSRGRSKAKRKTTSSAVALFRLFRAGPVRLYPDTPCWYILPGAGKSI